jgi:hypothetical protein
MSSKKQYNILQKNPKQKYDGSHYAITGTGGFEINTSSVMKLVPIPHFGKYDFTNSLQVLMKRDLFNSKLGIFEPSSNAFTVDKLQITTSEFLLTEEQIISLGSLETIYLDFKTYIHDYFNIPYGINMFQENIDQNPIFDKAEFCKLLREQSFNGHINILETNKILETLLEYNICGNRNGYESIQHGFMDGDLFYIPNGITILLSIDHGISQTYNTDICIRLYSE